MTVKEVEQEFDAFLRLQNHTIKHAILHAYRYHQHFVKNILCIEVPYVCSPEAGLVMARTYSVRTSAAGCEEGIENGKCFGAPFELTVICIICTFS